MENIWLIKLIFQKGKYHKKILAFFRNYAIRRKLSMMGTVALDYILLEWKEKKCCIPEPGICCE